MDQSQARGRSRLRRWLRRASIAACILFIVLFAFALWVYFACFADPPILRERPPILDQIATASPDGRIHLGNCWFLKDPGCSRLYLEGDPFTIGYANASLSAEFLELQEKSLIETSRSFFSSRIAMMSVCIFLLVNNRNLPHYVPLEYQYEILGLSQGASDPFPEYGPRYHRILNYHAAHDISHLIFDRPVLGCTAFAARGRRTVDGHLLIGRNFDFEAGRHFDENKIVGLYRPEKGRAFISVCWPGMAGAVTGLNEELIFCSVNGAHSEDRKNIGRPVSLVVRQVLQYAGNLQEAESIVREAPVFVSDSYLLADGKSAEAIVVEKSPKKVDVRRMADDLILQANHFECPAFAADAGNLEYMREGSSVLRRERLEEIVGGYADRLGPQAAVKILRDQQGLRDRHLAPGNRGAINPMIATHSVVVDLTAGVLWVSRGPHQLGRFEAFSIGTFDRPAAPPLDADPALSSGAYERLCRARGLFREAEGELRLRGRLGPTALAGLREAANLNPGDPDTHYLLGRVLEMDGQTTEALGQYRQALAGSPPFPRQKSLIEEAVRRLEGQSP